MHKILIIDDVQENLSILSKTLKEENYTTFTADSGELALISLQKHLPDLILLDIKMPGIDGFEVCKILKSNKDTKDIPIIFLSVATDIEDKIKGFDLGVVDYITKPFHKKELLARVKTHLELYHYTKLFKDEAAEKIIERDKELQKRNNELQNAKKTIEENETKLLFAQKLSKIGSYETDLTTGYWQGSDEFCEIFGFEKGQKYTQEEFAQIFHPDDFNDVMSYFEECINNKRDFNYQYRAINRITKEVINVKSISKIYYNNDGVPYKIHGTKQDITIQKKTEKELVKQKNKAEESEKLKSAFLANMSHEIRTPMNAIIGFSTFLLNPKKTRKQLDRYANIIINSGNHLLNLINDIIDISKFDAKQITVNNEPFDLNKLIDDLYTFFHSQLVAKSQDKVELYKRNGLKKAPIISDKTRLRQILINLIGNSLKFTKSGYIEFGYLLKDNTLQFFVKDTGIGIAKEKQETIFERFTQADVSIEKTYGGTGLGLSIAKACVEILRGEIWLNSIENMGSTFYFTIPYNEFTDDGFFVEEEKHDIHFNNETVLIAEDDIIHFQYLIEILEPYDLNILHAKTGEEVIEIANNSNVDIILMDIQLPLLNGWEATKQIRKTKPNLPIIAQTAYAYESDRLKSLSVGCNLYLSKPIIEKELLTAMKNLIK